MKKILSILIIGLLLLCTLLSCDKADAKKDDATTDNTTESNTPNETTTPDNSQNDQPITEGELDKSSDLIVALVDYLKEFWEVSDMPGKTLADKIDDIKNGSQPLHVAFDSENYYYVCGYYNALHEYEYGEWCCPEEYTWVKYDAESEIQKSYDGMNFVVAFQLNKALTVTDILSNESKTPDVEHFQIYTPTFNNQTNTAKPAVFKDDFVLLNSEDKNTVYYSTRTYFHELSSIKSVSIAGQYYILQFLEGVLPGEEFDLQEFLGGESTTYEFGDYYDAIMSVMDTEKYRVTKENGKISYYGLISFEDFANYVVLGKAKVGEELDKDSDLIQFLLDCMDNIYVEVEPREEILAENIDLIRGGAQPLYVTFDPESYYYVCGYCYEDDFGSFEHYEEYTWIKYDAETEIQEYYNGMNWCVAFQINKALTVTNILSDLIETPDMEYVAFFNPKFENGVNTKAPIWFNGTFTLLGDEDKDVIYYTREVTSQPLHYLVWDIIDGQYYVSIGKLGTFKNEEDFNLQEALSKERYYLGEYFDAIVAVIEIKAKVKDDGFVSYYGLISRENFANIIKLPQGD